MEWQWLREIVLNATARQLTLVYTGLVFAWFLLSAFLIMRHRGEL